PVPDRTVIPRTESAGTLRLPRRMILGTQGGLRGTLPQFPADIKARFRAEFINRVDEQIVFRALSKEDARRILRPMLDAISEELRKRHNVTLHVSEEAEQALAQAGYSPEYGVRELQRTVERLVQAPLSGLILSGTLKEHDTWQVVRDEEGLVVVPLIRKTG
ncbi:MAG: hypothetical protein NTX53_16330, partial [candidate division WOR-3 bacterium]|nr:hypothetical protein [candidate division WOR-3 bacterium]